MNTKLNLFLAATAVLSLASCEKYVPATANGDDAEYVIVIDGAEGTKAAASRSLDFADLTGNSSGKFTATLMKKNRESGQFNPVEFQPDWSWSKDSEAFLGSQKTEKPNEYGFAAQAVGSGRVNVSASYGGNALASTYATVTVADSRAISWSGAASTVTSGIIYSATLNCNYAGTVTVSSNNSSFLVGESTGSLSTTASVTFSESTGTAKTIYYKYTDLEETTVRLEASDGSRQSQFLLTSTTNAILTFDWSYGATPYSDTQWSYTLNNGTTQYVAFNNGSVTVDLGVPVSMITSLQAGVSSSRTFDDYEEEPDDYDMFAYLLQDENVLKSKDFYAGTTKKINLQCAPDSSGSKEFTFSVSE